MFVEIDWSSIDLEKSYNLTSYGPGCTSIKDITQLIDKPDYLKQFFLAKFNKSKDGLTIHDKSSKGADIKIYIQEKNDFGYIYWLFENLDKEAKYW